MSVIRLKIESLTIPATVVRPQWKGEIEQTREDDTVFFRDKLGSDFQFTGADYTLIKDCPDCERMEIYLEELCADVWTEQWRGYFTTYDCKFNDNKCTATVRPETEDGYECFMATIDDEISFGSVAIQAVKSIRGVYQHGQCCGDFIDSNDPTPDTPMCAVPAGWCFDHNTRQDIPLADSFVVSCFHRVRATGASPTDPPEYGTGWTYLFSLFGVHYWWRCPVAGEIDLGALSHGKRFNDVLDWMALQAGCDFTVRSHFFGNRNTHADPPVNGAYDYAVAYMQNLTIHQKSDVKCPDCSNEAESIVWKITWKKLLDDLRVMFNVYWYINDSNDFILEHITYFEAQQGLDVSLQNIVLSYGKGDTSAPKIEKFHWADDAKFSEAHEGYPIDYVDCGNGVKEHRINLFSNDIFYIRQQENQSDIADTGYCLVTNVIEDDIYYVQEENDPLGWMMLHDNLHRNNRYFGQGKMNDIDDTFYTVRKSREMSDFQMNVCCTDDFDPADHITTSAGDVEVTKARVSYFSGKENRIVTIESVI